MNLLMGIGLVLGAIALLGLAVRAKGVPLVGLVNIAEGTHEGSITKLTDAAISARHLLFKQGTDAHHIAVAGAADKPWGVVNDEASAAEKRVAVDLLGTFRGTMLMKASEAIAANADVYTAANGKVQDEPAAAGTFWKVGTARTAAGADNDLIEVQHCVPEKLVVIAALTSTDGTAGAAADLTALKAEAEKIGDDVRAIAGALATAAKVKVLTA